MPFTTASLLERAREILQDDAGTRYTDSQLLLHARDAVVLVRTLRPDLFVGSYATPLPTSFTVDDTVNLPDQFFVATAEYVAGMAEMRDDEFAVDGRAMTFRTQLTKKLVTGT